jgi:hypothetical protein
VLPENWVVCSERRPAAAPGNVLVQGVSPHSLIDVREDALALAACIYHARMKRALRRARRQGLL